MSHPVIFSGVLRRARNSAGLSMRRLAAEVGVTVAYISHLEAGRTRPAREMARRLARACAADEDEFSVLAGHVPEDVMAILRAHPRTAVAFLRERFAPYGKVDE